MTYGQAKREAYKAVYARLRSIGLKPMLMSKAELDKLATEVLQNLSHSHNSQSFAEAAKTVCRSQVQNGALR